MDPYGMRSHNMKPYDKEATCSKCGHDDMEDKWLDVVEDYNSTPMMRRDQPERVRRTCKNCGYAWNTVPLDLQEVE